MSIYFDGVQIALKTDGTVWAWGYNGEGQLGNGTTTDSLVPVKVVGLTGVKSISPREGLAVALKTDGTVWAWGNNMWGQLGNGTTTDSLVPVKVKGLTEVVALGDSDAGSRSVWALKSDGTVWAWGYNSLGDLGNGTTTASTVPVMVRGLTGVKSVSADEDGLVVALKSDGTVWAWGYNDEGQLGNGTTTASTVPVKVSGLTGVKSISTSSSSVVALKTDGTVWAWGTNAFGQLGNGTTTNYSPVPVQVNTISAP